MQLPLRSEIGRRPTAFTCEELRSPVADASCWAGGGAAACPSRASSVPIDAFWRATESGYADAAVCWGSLKASCSPANEAIGSNEA